MPWRRRVVRLVGDAAGVQQPQEEGPVADLRVVEVVVTDGDRSSTRPVLSARTTPTSSLGTRRSIAWRTSVESSGVPGTGRAPATARSAACSLSDSVSSTMGHLALHARTCAGAAIVQGCHSRSRIRDEFGAGTAAPRARTLNGVTDRDPPSRSPPMSASAENPRLPIHAAHGTELDRPVAGRPRRRCGC